MYVGSWDSGLYAFAVGCASGGATCTPLWTARTGDVIASSPVVWDGVVYVGSHDGKLYAFDAHCSKGGGTCMPIWTADTGSEIDASSPAVANGFVYIGNLAGKLFAYAVDCARDGGTCTPAWTANTGMFETSPAIANGVIYVAADSLKAYAVDCASGGRTGKPLWTGRTNGSVVASPVVADGVVYVGSVAGKVYAFALGGPPATSTVNEVPRGSSSFPLVPVSLLTAAILASIYRVGNRSLQAGLGAKAAVHVCLWRLSRQRARRRTGHRSGRWSSQRSPLQRKRAVRSPARRGALFR